MILVPVALVVVCLPLIDDRWQLLAHLDLARTHGCRPAGHHVRRAAEEAAREWRLTHRRPRALHGTRLHFGLVATTDLLRWHGALLPDARRLPPEGLAPRTPPLGTRLRRLRSRLVITFTSTSQFAARFGPQTVTVGCAARLVGMGLQIWAVGSLGVHRHIGRLVPGLILDGAAMGLANTPLASTLFAGVPAHQDGSASRCCRSAMNSA